MGCHITYQRAKELGIKFEPAGPAARAVVPRRKAAETEAAESLRTLDVCTLPPPPSTNNLYRNVPGKGRRKSVKYRAWLADAVPLLRTLRKPASVPCLAYLALCGEWNRHRDASNTIKPVEDAAVRAGVIPDDSLAYLWGVNVQFFPDVCDEPVVLLWFEAVGDDAIRAACEVWNGEGI